MSELLSRYQIAVLQEMGIPVWEKRAPLASSDLSQPSLAPDSDSLSSSSGDKLARLRSTIASKENHQKQPIKQPLSQDIPLINDIKHAVNLLVTSPGDDGFRCYLSNTLNVTENEVILPVTPDQLTPAQKKALWQAICKLTVSHVG